MSWRTDLNRMQRVTYKLQRAERDLYVATGPNGGPRLVKRVARRWLTRTLFRGLR